MMVQDSEYPGAGAAIFSDLMQQSARCGFLGIVPMRESCAPMRERKLRGRTTFSHGHNTK